MVEHMLYLLTLLSALGCGLIAGVFFAFSTFVMGALARLPPAHGVAAMQSINIVVLRPRFMAAFFGTAAACLLVALSSAWRWPDPAAILRLIGGALYLAGTIGVTIAANVPWNDALAAVEADDAESRALWKRYVSRWTAWNHVRTVAALAAAATLTIALAGVS